MPMRITRAFVVTSWIPLLSYAIAVMYLKGLHGWGPWAAAGVILPSLILSIIDLLIGVICIAIDPKEVGHNSALIAALVLSGSPLLIITLQHIVVGT